MAFEAFERIVANYTGLSNRFRSDFFSPSGAGANLYLTNGYRLRGNIAREFSLSFKELYDNLRVMFNLGVAIKKEDGIDVVRIEPMSYFFNNNTILSVASPKDISFSPFEDLLVNKVEVGYSEWANENTNGLDEVCGKRQYATNLRLGSYADEEKNRVELGLVCNFVTSSYLIEQARRMSDKATTDGELDGKIFAIALNLFQVSSVEYYGNSDIYPPLSASERNEGFLSVTGLVSPDTTYNLRYTPARNFYHSIPLLQAGLYKNFPAVGNIEYRSSEGNSNVTTVANSGYHIEPPLVAVQEGQDFVASLVSGNFNTLRALFDAEVVEMETKASFLQFEAIRQDFYGIIMVGDVGYYILEATLKPASRLLKLKLIKAV
jgi:hypothetical protein